MSRRPARGVSAAPLFAAVAVVAIGAVGAALVTQHVFGMLPCPWCVLQRLIFLVIAAFALLGLVWRGTAGLVVATAGVLLFALAGIAAALWQHFVAAATASCNLTLADRIVSGIGLDAWAPDVFAPQASCADAAVHLLFMPYEFWSLGLFILLGATAIWIWRAARR